MLVKGSIISIKDNELLFVLRNFHLFRMRIITAQTSGILRVRTIYALRDKRIVPTHWSLSSFFSSVKYSVRELNGRIRLLKLHSHLKYHH